MAAKKMFDPGNGKTKDDKEVNRGTQDELEIMRIIVEQNLSIRQAVLEKIRQTKFRLGLDKPKGDANAPKVGK